MKTLTTALLLTCCLLSTSMARDDILTTAAANGSFKTLVSLVVAADLDEALQGKGHFTVFAPTDEAFEKLDPELLNSLLQSENREQLAEILKYHVISRSISIAKHPPSHPLKSAKTLLGERVQFEREGTEVSVNQAKVVLRNIRCSNGLIHVIDAVLSPPEDQSVVAVAKKSGEFKTLLTALNAAGLDKTLSSDGPFTVFAPTDEAFSKLPKGVVEDLLKPESIGRLIDILKYHVASGKLSANEAVQAAEVETLLGEKVEIAIEGGQLKINESAITANDVEASNGIIHVIDQVLIPDLTSQESSQAADDSTVTITSNWNSPVTRDGIKAKKLIVRCAGAGNIRLTNVEAEQIETSVGGGGFVSIEGAATTHTVTVNGGGVLRAGALKSQSTEIQVNGGGDAIINSEKSIIARANAGAKLQYVDTGASIEKSINKYAKFEKLESGAQPHDDA